MKNMFRSYILVLCTINKYEDWINEKLLLDLWTSELVEPKFNQDTDRFITKNKFDKYIQENSEIEPVFKRCENVVAFGYYTNF